MGRKGDLCLPGTWLLPQGAHRVHLPIQPGRLDSAETLDSLLASVGGEKVMEEMEDAGADVKKKTDGDESKIKMETDNKEVKIKEEDGETKIKVETDE